MAQVTAPQGPLLAWDTDYAHWERTALQWSDDPERLVSVLVQLVPDPDGGNGVAKQMLQLLKGRIPGRVPVRCNGGERTRLRWLIRSGLGANEAEIFVEILETDLDQAIAENTDIFVPRERMPFAGPQHPDETESVEDPLFEGQGQTAVEVRAALKTAAAANSDLTVRRMPVMCVIDGDIGYLNTRFCKKTDTGFKTRIQRLWLQDQAIVKRRRIVQGKIYDADDLNTALTAIHSGATTEANTYAEMRADRRVQGAFMRRAGHGSHVMDLAAGADPDEAIDLPIFAVQMPSFAISTPSSLRVEGLLVQGVRWLIRSALGYAATLNDAALKEHQAGRPAEFVAPDIVLNCSLGTLAGPKNGDGFFERLVRHELELVNSLAPQVGPEGSPGYRATLFQSFGNFYRTRQVGFVENAETETPALDWRLQRSDRESSVLEIRSTTSPLYGLQVEGAPGHLAFVAMNEGMFQDVVINGQTVARLYRGQNEAAGRTVYRLFVRPTEWLDWSGMECAPAGTWSIKCFPEAESEISVQVQRDDTPFGYAYRGGQSYLADDKGFEWDPEVRAYVEPAANSTETRQGTGIAEATAHNPAMPSVGAVYEGRPNEATLYSSSGTHFSALSDRPGPVVSAPADQDRNISGVLAAGTISGSIVRLGGTSIAAPQAARKMAHTGQRPTPLAPQPLRRGALYADNAGARNSRNWPKAPPHSSV